MLSINTNLSSLIAQQSMSSATNKLNQAIERMTTGFKINSAKDNAANYSISQNMQTQLSSYDVAADNVAMGMDLVTTASDIINNMQDKATRLQALCTQARNGTYGAQSMAAINSEAGAIMAEIMRLYSTAEYNGVSLFNRGAGTNKEESPFLSDPVTYTDEEIEAMLLSGDMVVLDDSISSFVEGQKYLIKDSFSLKRFADIMNNNNYEAYNSTFILGADIDMTGVDWMPIGSYGNNAFSGTFDGNGHTISHLTIPDDYGRAGLFDFTNNATIKNLALENIDVKGDNFAGALIAINYGNTTIVNCYVTGAVSGQRDVGGLVGQHEAGGSLSISDSISYCTVSGNSNVGAIIGNYSNYYGGDLVINNVSTTNTDLPVVGYYNNNGTYDPDKALEYEDVITRIQPPETTVQSQTVTTLQVGIKSDSSCQITFDTNFKFDLSAIEGNIASDEALSAIMEFSNLLSEKSTQLGVVQNRLDSALESITVNMENLTSSLSTIRDADIAEVSSQYIQQQILQQASATLLATANQSPSIALQLI